MQNKIDLIKEHIKNAKLMQVATCENNQPWIFNCWFTYDEKENAFYFISNKKRKHSKQIINNPKVACSIIKEIPEGLGAKVQGLHFEGTAKKVTNSLSSLIPQFTARWKLAKDHLSFNRVKNNLTDVRLYKIKVTKFIWFDEVNFPKDPRQEVEITKE